MNQADLDSIIHNDVFLCTKLSYVQANLNMGLPAINPEAAGSSNFFWTSTCRRLAKQMLIKCWQMFGSEADPHHGCACNSDKDLKRYIQNAVEVDPDRPVLVDKYLDRADELDVDALCDKEGNVTICGIMQHIEQAGVHSGVLHLLQAPSYLVDVGGHGHDILATGEPCQGMALCYMACWLYSLL